MFNRFLLEQKMKTPLFQWIINASLVALIYIAAQIGGSLGIEGMALEFSLIWPAAGISLAAILIFGYRVLPGIFIGNFLYNFLELQMFGSIWLGNVAAAVFVSSGSTLQAFIGGCIIRYFSPREYFDSLKAILIFLIPAGLFTCIIGSVIGNVTLFIYGGLTNENIFNTLVTFWLGDLMGVYIFTPLIVVWVLEKPTEPFKKHLGDAIAILWLFIVVSVATFGMNYPFTHLYLPLCIWMVFRYSMHGATLAVFLTTILTVVLSSLGYGPFVPQQAGLDPLLFLVSFLEVIVATSLILAAVLKERAQSRHQIEINNQELEEEVHLKLEEIRSIYHQMFLKEKQASIGNKTFEVTKQILIFLEAIKKSSKVIDHIKTQLQNGLTAEKRVVSRAVYQDLLKELQKIDRELSIIKLSEERANRIAKIIQEHIVQSSNKKLNIRTVNLHVLINNRLEQAVEKVKNKEKEFNVIINKKYDNNVTSITALPWELAYAFDQFIDRSLDSVKDKWKLRKKDYQPIIEVETHAVGEGFEVIFKDNGIGISPKEVETYFHPFEKEALEGELQIGLSLAYDIIVNIHHGEVAVDSEKGKYFCLTLRLPQHPYALAKV